MDPDELFAQLQAEGDEAEEAPPRMARSRRIVMGEGGSDVGAHVEEGEEFDANQPLPPVPPSDDEKGPASGPTQQQRARWQVEAGQRTDRGIVEPVSPFWDAALGLAQPVSPAGPTPEQARNSERLSRFWDQFTSGDARLGGRNPIDPIVGLDQRAEAPIARVYQGLPIHVRDDEERAQLEGRAARATAQAPELATAGDAALAGIYTAMPNPSSAAGRVGLGAAVGGAVGGAHSLDAPVEDALQGAAIGGAAGLLGEGVSRAVQGPSQRTVQRLGERADDALLGATEAAGRGRSAIREFDRGTAPGQVRASRARSAQALRETGAVPRVGTIRQVAGSVDEALGRVSSGLDDIRSGMDGGGPTYESVAERLRQRAAQIAAEGPESAPLAEMLEARADDYARFRAQPVSYDRLVTGARRMRQMGMGRTAGGQQMSMPQEGLSEVDEVVREAYDDAVEAELGAAARQQYQQLRRQYRTLTVAQRNAASGEASAAGNRLFGLSEQLGLYGGSGAGIGGMIGQALGAPLEGGAAGAATMLAARAYRATEPTLRRSAADILYQIARRYPERLGRYARPILEAGGRGQAALLTTMHTLMQRDAEARRIFEEAQGLEQQE
jgi:hypothetical protein